VPGAVQVANVHIGSVIGAGGSNINRIRDSSGARVKVHDPEPGNPERTVEITGNEQQVEGAPPSRSTLRQSLRDMRSAKRESL
jgi:polyribonucleotide nucleotidyltransferase